MNKTVVRLVIVTVIFVAIQGVVFALLRQATYSRVVLPDRDIAAFPKQVGQWKGTDTALDDKTFVRVGAKAVVDRLYRDPVGEEIALHTAVFAEDPRVLPHLPTTCYGGNGWTKTDGKTIELNPENADPFNADLLTFERDGRRLQVLYWYQLGTQTCFNRDTLRKVCWGFRGQQDWPATIKILLQTSAVDPQRSEDRLRSMATAWYEWYIGGDSDEDTGPETIAEGAPPQGAAGEADALAEPADAPAESADAPVDTAADSARGEDPAATDDQTAQPGEAALPSADPQEEGNPAKAPAGAGQ
jgi:EpsI family protein